MTRRRRMARASAVAGAAFVLLATCCWWDSRWLDYWPGFDAFREAEVWAGERGYRLEGCFVTYEQEPDAVGGCVARVESTDVSAPTRERKVTVTLRRAWRLSGWEVESMTVEDVEPPRD